MRMDIVTAAIKSGVSCVCATCKRYEEGRDRNLPDGKCAVTSFCASPIGGDTFTHYQGPMTDFTQFCFVCSGEATQVVQVGERPRKIGICDRHLSYLNLRPMDETPDTRLLTLHRGDGRRELIQLRPKVQKSKLLQTMEATEEEWAYEDRKKGLL